MKAAEWNAKYAARELWGVEPNRYVRPVADPLPAGRALDLACGEGRNAIWLAERGWRVTAVDFSDVAVERGKGWAAERGVAVDWLVADLVTWVPPVAAFDFVLLCYLQLPDDERRVVWHNAARALAPGGTLLLAGHHSRNLVDGIGGPKEPAVLYTETDVTRELAGLTITRADEVLRPVDDGTAIDCVVVATKP
jgi:SAM-dependent methyltransferase